MPSLFPHIALRDSAESPPQSLREHLRGAWNGSLRFRLLALGLMPLLIAFPLVIGIVALVGGERANSLLLANLRSNLAGTRSYLEQVKADAGTRVGQLVTSERLVHLLHDKSDRREFDQLLTTTARGSGLDFLLIARADGTVIGSSSGVAPGQRLPDSYVIRQARIGVANAAFERFDGEQLASFSPRFPDEARIEQIAPDGKSASTETRGLMINAAAHFPLAANDTDAILVGGILLNQNFVLIEHLREIIFPVGTLPGDAEGMISMHVDDTSIAISRQRRQGQRIIGTRLPAEVIRAVAGNGQPWFGSIEFGGESYLAGYEPLVDGDGQRIGMVGAAFPDAPYQKSVQLIVGMIAGLLALTMLGISFLFLRTGKEFTQRLAKISTTMTRVRDGERTARTGEPLRDDELGQLSRHFDVLLDTIAAQDEIRRASLQAIADEASRRRALFEHERDGVVILNPDGSVFEANPKSAAMLGYSIEELGQMRLQDWEARFSPAEIDATLGSVGPQGAFFETVHRRKDGSRYPAEVAVSRAQWADRTCWLVLQRDITERKAVEAELAEYRLNLERLVAQRTHELNNRSEQLNAIFTLSPDGFVSFDAERRVSFANRAFLRMTRLDASAILGCDEATFSALLTRQCLPQAAFPGVAALRQARLKHATDADRHGNSRRQLIELAGPGNRVLEVGIRLAEAESVSQILYFRDVTHETEVDRMKSEFLSTAAHELRTPMASIYGYAELLMSHDFDADARQDLLATIFRQSELMASIINELLDLARIEARRGKDFVLERLALDEIVSAVVAGYKPPAGRASPMVAPAETPLDVKVDRKKMQQAVLNILANAYKYSPRGGAVSIAYRSEDSETGRRFGIAIRDQGIGMTPEELGRVCERFYRADTSGKIPGTGLGMSIVKEIVELHGGELTLASQPGDGTTVTLWVPAA